MQKLSEKTRFCPSILTHNGKYVAWTGLDHSLNAGIVYGSSPQLGSKYNFGEQSMTSPCLVSHNSQVFVAWTNFNRQINLAAMNGPELRERYVLQETETQDPPCIVSHQGKLWITWRDYNSPNRINVGMIEDHNITNHIVYATESTSFAPSMASFKDKLFLAWVSEDYKINIGEVAEHQLENKVKTIETSYETPWLSVENNELKLSWIGIDVGHHLNIATFENGRLTNKRIVSVPLTEEIAIIHRGPPTMHSFHRGIKIYREGHTGIRYSNGTFAYTVNASLPEPAPTNPLDKQKYDEFAKSLHNIILYKV